MYANKRAPGAGVRRRWSAVFAAIAAVSLLPLTAPVALATEQNDPDEALVVTTADPTPATDDSVGDPETTPATPQSATDEVESPKTLDSFAAGTQSVTEQPVSVGDMSIIGFSSEMPPYPAPPAVDGTAAAVLTDVMSDTWSTHYTVKDGVGTSDVPFPHWIAFDLGTSRDLNKMIFNVKNTTASPKDVQVFVTDNASLLQDPSNATAWGSPVAETTLLKVANSPQNIVLNGAKGRFVKFQATTGYNTNGVIQVSTLRLTENVSDEPTPPVEPGGNVTREALVKGDLTVNVAKEFPQIAEYIVGSGEGALTMRGNDTALNSFSIKAPSSSTATAAVNYAATTTFEKIADDKAQWVSTINDGPYKDTVITSSVTVQDEDIVKFRIDSITGPNEGQISEIGIPGHSLLSVDSSRPNAYLSRTIIDTDRAKKPDQYIKINSSTTVDARPVGTPYGFVWDNDLSAGLYSNATRDLSGAANSTGNRLSTQIVLKGTTKVGTLASGVWVWAPYYSASPCNPAWLAPDQTIGQMCKPQAESMSRYLNPETTIVIAKTEANDRGQGWQSSAVKLRDNIPAPKGAERVPERVAMRIPFNIASEATNPFLKTLDNTKRISQATDGLGQWVLLKGYGSEGHDSANSDYGSNYNERAGGVEAMNELIDEGSADYNADFAVHVNDTEFYAHAKAFNDWVTDGADSLSWGWLNQSYGINQRKDIGSGSSMVRFSELREQVSKLATIYIDVWYSNGWQPEVTGHKLSDMGFQLASEWSYGFEGQSIWSHWANDLSYGGTTNKGLNSDMIRFMFNHQRDLWNPDILLGNNNMKDFEGWTGQKSWSAFYSGVWEDNLPTKYLQHFPILTWEPNVKATFEGNVVAKVENGERVITQNGKEVARGDSYMLPWSSQLDGERRSSPLNADKMYFYSKSGGAKTFDLPDSLSGVSSFIAYPLSGDGRGEGINLTANGGKLTVASTAKQPYVIVPAANTALPFPAIQWGQFTPVKNPGFDAPNLDMWNPTGAVTRPLHATGTPIVQLGTPASSISQEITGLEPGQKYQLTSLVEIVGSNGLPRNRDFKWSVTGTGLSVENAFDSTTAENWVGSDPKSRTMFQAVPLNFVAPADGKVLIKAKAAKAEAANNNPVVHIDDVRIYKLQDLSDKYHFWSSDPVPTAEPGDGSNGGKIKGLDVTVPAGAQYWDFENNEPGYGPFVRGGATGTGDARTSISVLHFPYSQQDWKNQRNPFDRGTLAGTATDDVLEGSHSLKVHSEQTNNGGWVFRTTPSKVNFLDGHKYRVSFTYQATATNQFQWLLGRNLPGSKTNDTLASSDIPQTLTSTRFTQEFTAGCGSNFVGLRNLTDADSDFVIDQFLVEDLGASEDPAVCGATAGTIGDPMIRDFPNKITTTFTNNGNTAVTNVGMMLGFPDGVVPEGWKVQVETENGNLFESVDPRQTVSTTWLVTPPADATGGDLTLKVDSTYTLDCKDITVSNNIFGSVSTSDDKSFTKNQLKVTAFSAQSGEGPENALDDSENLWHSNWDGVSLPGWYRFEILGAPATVNGLGYLPRQSGGNGKLQGYNIEVSLDGTNWTKVDEGQWQQTTSTLQIKNWTPVQAKYVRMNILSVYGWDASGLTFASAQRLVLFGSPTAPTGGFDAGVRVPANPADCPTRVVDPVKPTVGAPNVLTIPVVKGVVYTDEAGNVLTGQVPIKLPNLVVLAKADSGYRLNPELRASWLFPFDMNGRTMVDPIRPDRTGNTVTIPEIAGVVYRDADGNALTGQVPVTRANNLTVVASPAPGYRLNPELRASWLFPFDMNARTMVDPLKPVRDGRTITVPEIQGVIYKDGNGTVLTGTVDVPANNLVVMASPVDGYRLNPELRASWLFPY